MHKPFESMLTTRGKIYQTKQTMKLIIFSHLGQRTCLREDSESQPEIVVSSLGALLRCFLFVEKNNVNYEPTNAKTPQDYCYVQWIG